MPIDANGSYSHEQAAAFKAKNRDFPLRWHPCGGWCKRIRGRTYYWGRVPPDEALQRYHHEKDYLQNGELPPPYDPQLVTVRDLANEFLSAKKTLVGSGELAQTTWNEYRRTCGHLVKHFGPARAVENLTPDDLLGLRAAFARGRNLVALRNEINRTRIIFKFAYESGLIERPVRYGHGFKRPAAGAIRRARYAAGRQDYTPGDVRRLLGATSGPLHAMILLGVSCGLGNGDCSRLEIGMLDLEGGWLEYPRPKTGAMRRAPLWPEVIEALRPLIGERGNGRIFRTMFGNPWSPTAVSHEFGKVVARLKLGKPGRGFYALRRTFRTIAAEAGDEPAANLMMGHVDDSTGGLYTERIGDERLKKVSGHVRRSILE